MGRVLARGDSTWEVGAGQGLIRWRTNRRARVFCSSERQRHNVARHDEGVAGPDPPLQAGRTHLDSSATVFITWRTADVIVNTSLVDRYGLHRRRCWRNRVRRRYVSTSAPGGAGCAAHGRASPSRLSRPSRAPTAERAAHSRRFRIRIASTIRASQHATDDKIQF